MAATIQREVADPWAKARGLPPPIVSFDPPEPYTAKVKAKLVANALELLEAAIVPRLELMIPIRLKNPLNASIGNTKWAAMRRAKENREQRRTGQVHTLAAFRKQRVKREDIVPCVVTLTRVSAGVLDDDNLAAACKHVRDGIADALGVDDGGRFVRWVYAQRKGPAKVYALKVEIVRSVVEPGPNRARRPN